MKKNFVIILLVLLVSLLTITATYAVIIEVTDNEGMKEIVNEITVRDIFTDVNGNYNDLYYDVKKEINVTNEEAEILMDSPKLNENLQIVAKNVVDYKANNITEAKLTNEELLSLLEDGVNNTNNISEETKQRVIKKAYVYKEDVSDYVYDIEIKEIGK